MRAVPLPSTSPFGISTFPFIEAVRLAAWAGPAAASPANATVTAASGAYLRARIIAPPLLVGRPVACRIGGLYGDSREVVHCRPSNRRPRADVLPFRRA